MRRVHVVGAGLAGLAAAVTLTAAGRPVTVYEAGPAAGGRCRSYFDRALGRRIDNGNHLVLSGNRAVKAYLTQIGAAGALAGPDSAVFPFVDVASGERWCVAPSRGRIPWWIFARGRRVPGTRARDYIALLALGRAKADDSVEGLLDTGGVLYRRLLEPLAVSALNTAANVGLAALLGAVVKETLMRGGRACLPRYPRVGLSETFVDPAVRWIEAHGGNVLMAHRISGLDFDNGLASRLKGPEGSFPVEAGDSVLLAVPPWIAADLVPGLTTPDTHNAIVNLHFVTAAEPGPAGFYGVVGGTAEWIFVRDGVVSVTVSAANSLVDLPTEDIAAQIWSDVKAVLNLADPMPSVRVVKERRATFAATATQEARRPGPRTSAANLVLAGDWTATGLPATIEGALRSGRSAAALLLAS